ncbi:uncharacterized protein MYCGRDRAFT_94788 [Zymoseptoria tritici IPO323]|uniref:Uncharacterized protein n=1 Tax=Zymoseptoria tritici (strain CBS 115943 / IPO323) TaxID=336722 RepID=F9XF61_ZYMTI|nr:uncharacterized protein MYCGRDRAFT_94788 [Zymoseptoria tritici IPO323]EGP85948.1 hypothetical protein MYCGRDRAFT_94788 [Zymoseptoria tritici IPO323]
MAASTQNEPGSGPNVRSFDMDITFRVRARKGDSKHASYSGHTMTRTPMQESRSTRITNRRTSYPQRMQLRQARQHNESSRLLRLSPELRNHIFELVLVDDEQVFIGANTTLPGLLSTSSQIRAETHLMFWQRNEFVWQISDYNAANLQRFTTSDLYVSFDNVARTRTYQVRVLDQPNWRNLLAWLYAEHSATTRETFKIVSKRPPREFIRIVTLLKDTISSREICWKEDSLAISRAIQRNGLASCDERWGREDYFAEFRTDKWKEL